MGRARETGFIVTWDVDSADGVMVGLVRRFVFGDRTRVEGRVYRYPGFVERDGVRYLGQSVLFVNASRLREIDSFLTGAGVDHEVTHATIG